MARVQVAKGSEGCAMAEMLGGLLRSNIEKSPAKASIFRALNTVVGIHIEDIDISLTLEFLGGRLILHEGIAKPPRITIRAESGTVMDLSNVSIRFGLPFFFDETGREILKNVRNGKIRMIAMPWSLLDVIRLTRVMSVQD
jgi:hypothetical protein